MLFSLATYFYQCFDICISISFIFLSYIEFYCGDKWSLLYTSSYWKATNFLLKFLLVLWESYTVCSCYIHTLPSCIYPLHFLPNFVFLFVFFFIFLAPVWFVLPIYLMRSCPLGHGQLIRDHKLRKSWFCLSHKLSIVNSFLSVGGVWLCAYHPLSILPFGLDSTHRDLFVHALTTSMPCCVRKHCIFVVIHCLRLFPLPSPHDSWASGKEGMRQKSHIGLSSPHSLTLCTFTSLWSQCQLPSIGNTNFSDKDWEIH